MTSFREAYWSGDPTGLEDAHTDLERMKIEAELCIVDPERIEDFFEKQRNSAGKAESDYQRRKQSVREIYQESLTYRQWTIIKVCFDDRCAYCWAATRLFRDHVTPIFSGGRDRWQNVVPACRRCNSSKSDKSLEEWLAGKVDATAVLRRYSEGVERRNAALANDDGSSDEPC